MSLSWHSPCGRVDLFHMDCLNYFKFLKDRSVDVLTDPPYGIDRDRKHANGRAGKQQGKSFAPSTDYGLTSWDSEPCSAQTLAEILRVGSQAIIWGGHHFALPPTRCVLVWDKMTGANDYADCEVAWTNLDKPVRRIQFQWHGMLRDEPGERVHPTQKPVSVMAWSIRHLKDSSRPIFDPMMGSGTSGVAAVRLGRRFVGCEIHEPYFEIAKARIQEALNAEPLFHLAETVPSPVQMTLF